MVKMADEGEKAPDFELPGDGGSLVRLSALAGRKVVVYFYPKDDTSGCTTEALGFSAAKGDFSAADTEIIGISADSVASHEKFKSKYDLTITLASDEQKAALDEYGVWVEKSMYGRKYKGIERATFLIDREGRIAKVWRKVKIPGHIEAALEAARALP